MVTPMLLFSSFCLLVGDMLFGFDTASFGGILVNPVSQQNLCLIVSTQIPIGPVLNLCDIFVGVHQAIWLVQRKDSGVRYRLSAHFASLLSCLHRKVRRVFRCRPGHREIRPSHSLLHHRSRLRDWYHQ